MVAMDSGERALRRHEVGLRVIGQSTFLTSYLRVSMCRLNIISLRLISRATGLQKGKVFVVEKFGKTL